MLQVLCRRFGTLPGQSKKALILGVNTRKGQDETVDSSVTVQKPEGTDLYHRYDENVQGKLSSLLSSTQQLKTGQARTFYGVDSEFNSVVVVGLGPKDADVNDLEYWDEGKENVRNAMAAGMKSVKDSGVEEIVIDTSQHISAAAEGAHLASWSYKESDRKKFPAIIQSAQDYDDKKWIRGVVYAECQNWARHLMDSPANLMTPSIFANSVKQAFADADTKGSVSVYVREREWIEQQKMGAFLSVSQGSDQPPQFVEVHYESHDNSEDRPLVLVGKGVTFDSGGISIKPSQGMEDMRADMGGAATMVAAILAAVKLNMKGKVTGLFPLCENLLNGKATKPGDVVTARNGVTIQVDNTDAEGRLLLADALLYGQDYNPLAVVNAATLTGAIAVALGASASGVYANNEEIWLRLLEAGVGTGDRVWRMPLFDYFSNQVKPAHLADVSNVGKGGRYGGSCTAAAFLRHFVKPTTKWAHLDIAGVMSTNGKDHPYLCSGMSGRPTRMIAEFIRNFHEPRS